MLLPSFVNLLGAYSRLMRIKHVQPSIICHDARDAPQSGQVFFWLFRFAYPECYRYSPPVNRILPGSLLRLSCMTGGYLTCVSGGPFNITHGHRGSQMSPLGIKMVLYIYFNMFLLSCFSVRFTVFRLRFISPFFSTRPLRCGSQAILPACLLVSALDIFVLTVRSRPGLFD